MIHLVISKLRLKLLAFLTRQLALPILKIICSPQKIEFTKQALYQLPEGTLGRELVTRADKKNLKRLPYYGGHDIKHILLQYNTTDEGAVCLWCFRPGNHHLPFPQLAAVVYSMVTMPGYRSKFIQAYKCGSPYKPIEKRPKLNVAPACSTTFHKINKNEIVYARD